MHKGKEQRRITKNKGKEKFSLSVPITPFNAEGILEKD